MEEQWVVDRCKLREVGLEPPEGSRRGWAEAVGRSKSWVKKWLRRIRSTTLEDHSPFCAVINFSMISAETFPTVVAK